MTESTTFPGLLASERSYRTGDPENVRDLRDAARDRRSGLIVIDPGEHGAILVFDKWWKRFPVAPYFAVSMSDPRAIERAAQAGAEVEAAVIVSEAGYLNVRQPSSLVTARRAGIAIGALCAHIGYTVHVVYTPPASWQAIALPNLSASAPSEVRKREAIEVADAFIPSLLAAARTKERRSGIADAWGMATWFALSSMVASPIRR